MKINLVKESKSLSQKVAKKSQNVATEEVVKDATYVAFAVSQGKESAKITHAGLAKRLESAIADKGITGKAQTITIYRDLDFSGYRHVVIVGLGEKPTLDSVRRGGAEIKKAISALKTHETFVHFDGVLGGKKDLAKQVQALTEGLLLASYDFSELKSKKTSTKATDEKETIVHILSSSAADAAVKKAFSEACILVEAVNFSRRLGDLPGNLMNPKILADTAVQAAKGTGLKVSVWDKARIKKEKMGGLLGVSMGSEQEPRFIIMEYKGTVATKKPVVFVGKGLTFDSGGISLKPGAAMEEMKYDMCGGANVIGTMLAIAKLKLKVNAIGLVPASENMPGPAATKPGDVHTARNGKTFEVNNTDAEGRLILSDALCFASELKPQLIVDAATLTGAIIVALSNIHTGYFTKNSSLKTKIEKAADISGEWVWQMPLTEEHTKDMKGTFADFSNISSGKGAGSATAAAFLEHFVEEGIPWAHFDIAGTAWAVGGRLPWCSPKGASGVMVRTFVELAKQYV
jgi:leucyl aminopeptidase